MPDRNAPPGPCRLRANSEPLFRRLPKQDEHGRFLGDFMMLIPGLREMPGAQADLQLARLQRILDADDDVVFADLNLPLNLLWVSVRQRHGVVTEVATGIREHFPGARLVGHTIADKKERPNPGGLRHRLTYWVTRFSRPLRLR